MRSVLAAASTRGDTLEIIAFRLNEQEFCLRTATIREIRSWTPATPIPHAPAAVVGMMNLRGTVIPIIDLAAKLGMKGAVQNERSAIVVADVNGMTLGLLVDQVSDILTVPANLLQPVPNIHVGSAYSDGIITQDSGMICFLNLGQIFDLDHAEMLLSA